MRRNWQGNPLVETCAKRLPKGLRLPLPALADTADLSILSTLQELRLHGHSRVESSLWCESGAFLVPIAGAGSPPAFAPLCAIKNFWLPKRFQKAVPQSLPRCWRGGVPRRDETRAASLLILRTGPSRRSLRPVDTATDQRISSPSSGYLLYPVPRTEGYFSLPLGNLLKSTLYKCYTCKC